MAEKDAKPKKQSTIKQIIQIYKYTAKEDKALPWLEAGAFLLPVVVMIIIGLIAKWTWLTWIFTMITAIMLGMLLATMMLTRRADAVGYKQIDGKPGAAIGVLSNMQKAGFDFPQEPVWIDPKTKDAIWRGTSMNGIYLIGEGEYGRVMIVRNAISRASPPAPPFRCTASPWATAPSRCHWTSCVAR